MLLSTHRERHGLRAKEHLCSHNKPEAGTMTTRQDVLNTKQQASDTLRKVRRVNLRMYHDLSTDWHKASVALIDGELADAEELFIDIVMDAHTVIEDALEAARIEASP